MVLEYGVLGKILGSGLADKLVAPENIEKITSTGGLESVQGALDRLLRDVSGKKLVVEL